MARERQRRRTLYKNVSACIEISFATLTLSKNHIHCLRLSRALLCKESKRYRPILVRSNLTVCVNKNDAAAPTENIVIFAMKLVKRLLKKSANVEKSVT